MIKKSKIHPDSTKISMQALSEAPQGILYSRRRSTQPLFIIKRRNQIQLIFFDPDIGEVESRLDPEEPLVLVSPYTQAMMLGLLWKSEPANVHVIGLGGGRIPMILRHHFPELSIECTENNPDVMDVAIEYFGLVTDSRLKVIIQDGREYLRKRDPHIGYDIIMVDAFRGVGFGPLPLATKEFFQICENQLLKGGMVVVNVLPRDPLLLERIKTIASVFQNICVLNVEGSFVLFGGNTLELEKGELVSRAKAIENSRRFLFPFSAHAVNLRFLSEIYRIFPGLETAEVLTDSFTIATLPVKSNILKTAGRNDPCPCGSGKKYKRRHGHSQ